MEELNELKEVFVELATLVMFVSFVLSIIIRLKFDNPKKGFTVGNSEGFLGTMEYLLVICIPVFLAFLTLLLTGGLQK